MPFQKIEAEKLSLAVVRQIELLILRGILKPGERLPSERDLAERMGVSRPSLREAVAELQARGLLTTRAGSGIFVADVLSAAFSPALIRLFSTHDEAVFDYLALRRDLEGLAATRAVLHGTDTDLQVIASVFAQMEAAHAGKSPKAEARLDAEFHMAIFEASHNVILVHMMRAMFGLLKEGVFYNRAALFAQLTTRETLLNQHRAINDAIQARDADAARSAIESHLDFIRDTLRARADAERHDAVAQQRLEHGRRP